MLLTKRTRKAVAATFLLLFLTDTFAPGVSYALTSGPTQPEATSFEPVDTTDMVNMQTGDMTYNLPLLDVPGPEGGYPLSLSYHAGIQTNMDASWVGLGWTLNPGAINRSVNGLPDDWAGIKNNSHVYWQGNTYTTYGIGVSMGFMQGAGNASFGLTVAHDSYRGFSVGFSSAFSFGPASVSYGFAPFGNGPTMSAHLALVGSSVAGVKSSMGLNFSTDFSSFHAGTYGDIGVMGESFQGTLATNGKTSSAVRSGGAPAFIHSSKEAGIQSSSVAFNIPTPWGVTLSYSKTRKWTNESTNTFAAGSLNPLSATGNNVVYDNYSLLEDPSSSNIDIHPDPTLQQGGAMPDYDIYDVSAQGLAGTMRPYNFQGELMGQAQLGSDGRTLQKYYSYSSGKATGFRFVGDFSNSFRQAEDAYSTTALNTDMSNNPTTPPFDTDPRFGSTVGRTDDYGNGTKTNNYGAKINGTDVTTMALAGSRHVDIGVKVIPYNIEGYNSTDYNQAGMIKGFSVTNESGVTYSYGLPAYSYGEESYQEKIDKKQGLFFNRSTKSNAYAYTWYLTSVTGSDYVDRNNNQKADEGDWGYWVNFEYGKWSGSYVWRNPAEGFHVDEDNTYRNCSMGYREVYYLNAIRTRTHIALFEKDLRNDAKGASPVAFEKNGSNSDLDYTYTDGLYNLSSEESMKLSRIYLLNIADAGLVSVSSGINHPFRPYHGPTCGNCQMDNYILDKSDVDAVGRSTLDAKALRVIDFNYDYSLCPNTTNSFSSLTLNGPTTHTGKLTLNAVTIRGKNGVASLPSLQFTYDLPIDKTKADGTVDAHSFTTSTPVFQVGDMLQSGSVYYGVITAFNAANNTYTLTNSSLPDNTTATSVTLHTTKNPPYNKDAYDSWGMYKSDINSTVLNRNENLGRSTSEVSSKSVDAWSLRSIKTQLGDVISLNYESDTYHTVIMDNSPSLVMSSISLVPNSNNSTIQFKVLDNGSSTMSGTQLLPGNVIPKVLLLIDALDPTNCINCHIKPTPPPFTMTIESRIVDPADGNFIYTANLGSPITYNQFMGRIWTGNLWTQSGVDYYGGGLRVNSVIINHTSDNSASSINYSYNSAGASSGVTSYLPLVLDGYDAVAADSVPPGLQYPTAGGWYHTLQRTLYNNISPLYPLAKEMPPPYVMYEYVTETAQHKSGDESVFRAVPGSTQYQFQVLRKNMVDRKELNPRQQASSLLQYARNWVLQKFVGGIGNVRRVTQFDVNGNKLSETVNHYLHDDLETLPSDQFFSQYKDKLAQFNSQGLLIERYSETKTVNADAPGNVQMFGFYGSSQLTGNMATMLAREEYPCVQTSQTVTNYVNGTASGSTTLAFDFYSGEVIEKIETDAYGNNFMTRIIPAYQEYPSMGLKINNDDNSNMLTQTAETFLYKTDGNLVSPTKLGLVSAVVNTWSNGVMALDVDGTSHIQNGGSETVNNQSVPNGNIWRPQTTYEWMSSIQSTDGLTALNNFTDFNWAIPTSSDPSWKRTSDITLYDVFSKAIEERDVNNNYSTVRMDYGEKKVIMTGSPANYYECAYSGAEDAALSQTGTAFVKAADGSATGAAAHTGAQSLILSPSGKKGFLYSVPIVSSGSGGIIASRSYTASVWVKSLAGTAPNVTIRYSVNGTTMSPANLTKTAGLWTLVSTVIPGNTLSPGTFSIWCQNDDASTQAYVDDMKFQPLNANTAAYVYDPFSGELTYTLDNSNLYTRFVYDPQGRLVQVYKEKLNAGSFSSGEFRTNQYAYNYSAPKFSSPAINTQYLKNNCPLDGQLGSSVTVNIPSGQYVSFIDPTDAFNIADAYAQSYANTQGSCTCSPAFSFMDNITNNFHPVVQMTGSRVNLDLVFTWPSGATIFNLGNIQGACGFPNATRDFTVLIGSTEVNVEIGSNGLVQLQVPSGTPLSGQVELKAVYDTGVPLFYNNQVLTGTFFPACPAGQGGNSVSYSLPLYSFADVTQSAANAAANTAFQTQGQAAANATCVPLPTCTFSFAGGITGYSQTSVSVSGSTGHITLSFGCPNSPGSNTVLGSIVGGCNPTTTQTVTNVSDAFHTGGKWSVTINPSGSVSAQLTGNTGQPYTTGAQVLLSNLSYTWH